MPRPRRWTDAQLADAVATSRTLSEVCRRLGLRPGKYDGLRAHIRRLGLDASHLPRASEGSPRTTRRFRDEELVQAVRAETSVYGVLRRLGYPTSGGMFRFVVAHIRRLDLDTSHSSARDGLVACVGPTRHARWRSYSSRAPPRRRRWSAAASSRPG